MIIDQHNSDENETHTLGINHLADLMDSEIDALGGYIPEMHE